MISQKIKVEIKFNSYICIYLQFAFYLASLPLYPLLDLRRKKNYILTNKEKPKENLLTVFICICLVIRIEVPSFSSYPSRISYQLYPYCQFIFLPILSVLYSYLT
jgi:hypothetical protein